MKKINKQSQQIQSVLYYVMRVGQRVSLCVAAGLAGLSYVWLIANSLDISTLSLNENIKSSDVEPIGGMIEKGLNILATAAVSWAIVAVAISVGMFLLLPRVRKFEKRFVVDTVVYAALIILAVIMSQAFLRAFYVAIID